MSLLQPYEYGACQPLIHKTPSECPRCNTLAILPLLGSPSMRGSQITLKGKAPLLYPSNDWWPFILISASVAKCSRHPAVPSITCRP